MWDLKRLMEEDRRRRRLRLQLLVLVVMAGALLVLGGCNISQRLQTLKGSKAQVQPGELPETVDELGSDQALQEMTKVVLYFEDAGGRWLVPESQEIPKVTGIARAALEALCRGPVSKDLRSSLPAGTQVRGVNVKPDGTCVVDLSREVTRIPDQEPKAEALAVAAIVNTLTEFPTVKRVQILVEGQTRETLAGHIPIDVPLLRNMTYVKE
ncbi:MAG: GerMN domain-containing protein [Thermacetogeniaceae bacterium]